jgi:uncharacterized integral membrane protein (TIGR00698 family)
VTLIQARARLSRGLIVVALISAVATPIGWFFPVLGAPVAAVLIAAVVGNAVRHTDRWQAGASFTGRRLLAASIVLLGANLSLQDVGRIGLHSLPVLLVSLTAAFVVSAVAGRWLGVRGDVRTLIGAGTGICGASAIAAVSGVVRVAQADVAYALGTIFAFNVIAVLTFPALGHLFGLNQHHFGLWAGTAVNDTSSVVAASTVYGSSAVQYATVVKLTRTLAIVPVCAVLGRRGRREPSDGRIPVPAFILGFLVASALDTVGAVPAAWHGPIRTGSTVLITAALAGVGLGVRWVTVRQAGVRPLLLGGLVWIGVAATSLALIG